MRVGIRSILASGRIRAAMLLGVVPIAMVILGSDVFLGQPGIGTAAQAPLYTAIDLHPPGFKRSEALGVSGEQQVGVGYAEGDWPHALVWRGTAASAVDLISSHGIEATAICGGQQVGYGDGFRGATGPERHALLWRGSADSVVDLHPSGFGYSQALGTSGEQQVGSGFLAAEDPLPSPIPFPPPFSIGAGISQSHALLWRGSADSVVDLHPSGFASSEARATSGGQQVGSGTLYSNWPTHALLWRGSADSVVDLHPRGSFDASEALGTIRGQQVGRGTPSGGGVDGPTHALLWRGSAASVVDLNPRGFTRSAAGGTNGEEQVGEGDGHALLWRGSAASVVDLHAFLPPDFVWSSASGIDAAGDIVGAASAEGHWSPPHAILWKRNTPASRTTQEQTPCEAQNQH